MTSKWINALAAIAVVATMPAYADDARPASEHEKPGVTKAGDVSPPVAQAMVDDVNIGLAVGPDGRIPAARRTDDFIPGESIYLTMDVSDATPGTKVKVVWVGDEKVNDQHFNMVSVRSAHK